MIDRTQPIVVHVVESLSSGGLERVVTDLAIAQLGQGWQVSVVCLFHRGELAEELERAGIEVHLLGKSSGLDLRIVKRLRRRVRDLGATVVHSQNQMAHYYSAAATLGLGITLVNTRHGMGARGAIIRFTRRELLYRMALPLTDSVVSVCEANRQLMRRKLMFGARRSVVIRNGIHTEKIWPRSSPQRNAVRDKLGIGRDQLCFATVGRLSQAKNQTSLLRAYAKMAPGRHCLLIVGDGAERATLDGLIEQLGIGGSARLLGARSDVPELLSAFDVFVLPSISEGYSIALLEAAVAGLPIVATDVGGNNEIVGDSETGYLIPACDDDALQAAMQRFVDQPELVERLGSASLRWAEHNATFRRMVEDYNKVYRGVAP